MDHSLVWEMIIKSTLLLCVPVVLGSFTKVLPANLRVTVAIPVFIGLLCLPVVLSNGAQLQVSIPVVSAATAPELQQPPAPAAAPAAHAQGTANAAQPATLSGKQSVGTNLLPLLLLAITITLAMLVRVVLDYLRCDRLLTALPEFSDSVIQRELVRLKARLGIDSALTLKEQNFSASPLTFSPPLMMLSNCGHVIALPRDFAQWTPEHRNSALVHELSHIQRNDCRWYAFARMVTALYWWHPLAWRNLQQLHTDMEQASDNAVLASAAGLSALSYASHLVAIANKQDGPRAHVTQYLSKTLLPMAANGALAQRVRALLSKRKRGTNMSKAQNYFWSTTTLASALLLATLGIAAQLPEQRPYLPVFKTDGAYPPAAKQQKVEGFVVVEFGIDETGATIGHRVIEQHPDDGTFAMSALEAARKFRYLPKREAGKPIAVSGIRNRITYKLDKPNVVEPVNNSAFPEVVQLTRTSNDSLGRLKAQLEAAALTTETKPASNKQPGDHFLELAELSSTTQPALAEYFLVRAGQLGTTDQDRLTLAMATTLYHRGAIEPAQTLFNELAATNGHHSKAAASWVKALKHEAARRALVHDTMLSFARK